jgi:hypothetical protein
MAKGPYNIHSLNGGEVSPRFEARQDQNKYLASAFKMENFIPLILGGARRREGSAFVAEAKAAKVRLDKFLFNNKQAYLLEFSAGFVRIYKDGAVLVDLPTPYDADMIDQLYGFQSADVRYICSDGTLQVQKLQRTDAEVFSLLQVVFNPPALKEDEPTGTDLNSGNLTLSGTTGNGITVTAANSTFLAGDVGRTIVSGAGRAHVTVFTSATQVTADVLEDFASTTILPADWKFEGSPISKANPSSTKENQSITVSFDINTLRAADAKKFLIIYGGTIRIDTVKDARNATGTVLANLNDANANNPAATFEWTLNRARWSAADGFPQCGTFFGDRMMFATKQSVDASVTADFENFARGSADDNAIARTIADDQVNPIIAMSSDNLVQIYTNTGEYFITPSQQDGPLTPKDFNVKPASTNGTRRIKPARSGGQILYAEFGGRAIREQRFNFIDNKYVTPNLSRLADHLTEYNDIKRFDFQQRPWRILWCVRDDGILIGLVYERDEEVVGWFRWTTNGRVKDVCVIPNPALKTDDVYVAVERDLPGGTKTYIEVIHTEDLNIATREWREHHTDCSMIVTPVNGILSGLDPLEGMTVWVVGDGMLFNAQRNADGSVSSTAVVTGGQITLSPRMDTVAQYEVGLGYNGKIVTLPPIVPKEFGGPLMAVGWETCAVKIRRTLGLSICGEPLPFRQAPDAMQKHIPLKRGNHGVSLARCDEFGRVTLEQNLPFPAEILCVFGIVSVGQEPKLTLEDDEAPPFYTI